MEPLGRLLMLAGGLLLLAGLLLVYGPRLGWLGHLGRLPGDIIISKGNYTAYFPLATSLLLSLVLTLLFYVLRIFRR